MHFPLQEDFFPETHFKKSYWNRKNVLENKVSKWQDFISRDFLFQGLSFHRTQFPQDLVSTGLFQCQNLGLHFFHRTLIFNFNVEYSRMGFISGLETYHLICTQLYRTLPELYLGMIKHKYLCTDMYTILPYTTWTVNRDDQSYIFIYMYTIIHYRSCTQG